MRNAPALHGRDHLPGGADPIPGLTLGGTGGSGGGDYVLLQSNEIVDGQGVVRDSNGVFVGFDDDPLEFGDVIPIDQTFTHLVLEASVKSSEFNPGPNAFQILLGSVVGEESGAHMWSTIFYVDDGAGTPDADSNSADDAYIQTPPLVTDDGYRYTHLTAKFPFYSREDRVHAMLWQAVSVVDGVVRYASGGGIWPTDPEDVNLGGNLQIGNMTLQCDGGFTDGSRAELYAIKGGPLTPPPPENDNLPDATPLMPVVAADGGDTGVAYTWEGTIGGTNVGATLDSILDPIFLFNGEAGYAGASVWYLAIIPPSVQDGDFELWITSTFACYVQVYFPSSRAMRWSGEGQIQEPEGPIIWPTCGAQLFELVNGGTYNGRSSGDLLTFTGDIAAGSDTITNVSFDDGFSPADFGLKPPAIIEIPGAGPGGSNLVTTLVGYRDYIHGDIHGLRVANPASTTVTGVTITTAGSWGQLPTQDNINGNWSWASGSVETADVGDEIEICNIGVLTGCPIYVEVAGQGGVAHSEFPTPQEGSFSLRWQIGNVDNSGDDTQITNHSLRDFI